MVAPALVTKVCGAIVAAGARGSGRRGCHLGKECSQSLRSCGESLKRGNYVPWMRSSRSFSVMASSKMGPASQVGFANWIGDITVSIAVV